MRTANTLAGSPRAITAQLTRTAEIATEALRGLHSDAEPFAANEAAAIVEAELGAPLSVLYADFDHEPFAAGAGLATLARKRRQAHG